MRMPAIPGTRRRGLRAEVRRLRLRPGDQLVITVPGILSAEQAFHLRRSVDLWARRGGTLQEGQVLVLDQGAKLHVVHPIAAPETK